MSEYIEVEVYSAGRREIVFYHDEEETTLRCCRDGEVELEIPFDKITWFEMLTKIDDLIRENGL